MKMKKTRKVEKLNLIPILDAIFIFIFFLLMSAQFVDIYEIGSDAPAISTLTQEQQDQKEPLNLTIKVKSYEVVITTGLDNKVYKTIPTAGTEYDLKTLASTLIDIKMKNIDETSIIIKPDSTVKYKKIVQIMDTVKKLEPENNKQIVGINKKGQKITTRTLFDQIIFETII